MFQNDNKAIVKKLIKRIISSDKRRNFFIIAAITLTTFMIASVFSVGMSFYNSQKMQETRLMGTKAHAALSQPTNTQIEHLKNLDYIKSVGISNNVAFVESTPQMGDMSLTLRYLDKTEWQEYRAPAFMNIVGSYPQKANEIMIPLWVLERLGITDPKIGMSISLSYTTNMLTTTASDENALYSEVFTLSGYYTSYMHIRSGNRDMLLVSEELSRKYDKTVELDGVVNFIFTDSRNIEQYIEQLHADLQITENQVIAPTPMYVTYSEQTNTFIALSVIVVFLMFTGYLLIYNVLYISVSRDIRFYGLLKTVGTTPKQLRRIVTGQVMRLCVIGIPVGAIIAGLLSFVVIPMVSKMSNIETGVSVSFSPIIYISAALLAIATSYIGAVNPAKKAARISLIEAVKYTGTSVKKNHTYTSIKGKPYRMAFRNIFRDRKRAVVVFLSLFLGITTFITITTIVSSIDADIYVSSYIESDFILQNNTSDNSERDRKEKFDDAFIERIRTLPGIEDIQITLKQWSRVKYSPEAFGEHLEMAIEKYHFNMLTKEEIENNFSGFIIGIDIAALIDLNKSLSEPIDINAFERGEFALIATDEPGIYENVGDMEITILPNENILVIPLGGFVPDYFKNSIHGIAPTIYVSNTFLKQIVDKPFISSIYINTAKGYDEQTLTALKEMTDGDYEISRTSRLEARESIKNMKIILNVLGSGISMILGFIGILNFINIMSVGIMVRKHELATLESIGMSRKQIRKLMIYEGLGYAMITLFLVLSVGNTVTYGIFKLFQQQASYAIFTYPFIPMAITVIVIFAICFVTPEILYRSISKATIVERLREAE